MKSYLLSVLLLAALPVIAGDAPATYETVLTKRVDGELTIDVEGHVVAHAFRTEMEPEIRSMLEKAIASWKFHPYLVDGVAVKARSRMRVTVVARQANGAFKVSIDNVSFNGDQKDGDSGKSPDADPRRDIVMRAPRRPPSIQYPRYAVNGMTVVAVRLGQDGKVEDAIATQTVFFNAKGGGDEFDQARRQMEDNAVAGIRRWKFAVSVPEGMKPRPEDLTGIITVNYLVSPPVGGTPRVWRQETRSLNRSIPWISDRHLAQSVRASDLDAESAMFDLESGFRLREGEAGVVL